MRVTRIIVVSVGLAVFAAATAAWLVPRVSAQVWDADAVRDVMRRVQFLGTRGATLGVRIRDVSDADVRRQKLASLRGAVIEGVESRSPAERAGLKPGDIVVSFDGEAVRSARQFARLVDETPPGRTVAAIVQRDGEQQTLDVTPAPGYGHVIRPLDTGDAERLIPDVRDLPDLRGLERLPDLRRELDRGPGQGALGASVQDLTPDLAQYFGVKEGVLVTAVRDSSAAAGAGLKAGDVITSVNGHPVDRVGELRRRLAETDGKVALGITRDRKAMSLDVVVEQPGRQTARRRWAV